MPEKLVETAKILQNTLIYVFISAGFCQDRLLGGRYFSYVPGVCHIFYKDAHHVR
jgi:hypothetical protein